MIQSIGKRMSAAEGKKPEEYILNPKYCHTVGCYVHDQYVRMAISDFSYNYVGFEDYDLSGNESLEEIFEGLSEHVRNFLKEKGLTVESLAGIGICMDGIIDSGSGIFHYSPRQPQWPQNTDVAGLVRKYMPEAGEVYVLNSGRAAAYELFLRHHELFNRDVYQILTGETVGCYINKKQIMRGAYGCLGEVGHVVVDPTYRLNRCGCGRYGCFGSLISESGVMVYAKHIAEKSKDAEFLQMLCEKQLSRAAIFHMADEGNEMARAIVGQIAEYFFLVMRSIVLISDPEIIMIAGEYGDAGTYFQESLKKLLSKDAFTMRSHPVELIYDKSPTRDKAQGGCACYAVDQHVERLEFA
ncbi:MAG: ROK family protein [Clostridium sp.]|nr:ROK family protein [Clostridium sp.]